MMRNNMTMQTIFRLCWGTGWRVIAILCGITFSVPGHSMSSGLNKEQLVKALVTGRDQLTEAITGMQVGRREIEQIYPQIKTQLIDPLNSQADNLVAQAREVSGALEPLESLPGFLKDIMLRVTVIDDIETTLSWIVDVPMTTLVDFLRAMKSSFDLSGRQFDPESDSGKKLYQAFQQSADKLTSAVKKLERVISVLS